MGIALNDGWVFLLEVTVCNLELPNNVFLLQKVFKHVYNSC